jgi:N-methylhydantoinase A
MMVNLRLSALGRIEDRLPPPALWRQSDGGERGRRPVIFDSGNQAVSSPIFLRSGLKAGDRLEGPAVIEELGATILLYPGDKMRVNEFGHLVIDLGS